jgi:hypothetical protein
MPSVRRLALLIALVLAGCGGGDDTPSGDLDAGEFLQRITAEHLSGEFSDSWEDLHPAHQQLISQIQFVYCGERAPALEEDATVRIISVRPVEKELPRIPEQQAQAVRIQIRDKQGVVDTYTAHAVKVGDRWRWILSDAFVTAVESGKCPDGSPLP